MFRECATNIREILYDGPELYMQNDANAQLLWNAIQEKLTALSKFISEHAYTFAAADMFHKSDSGKDKEHWKTCWGNIITTGLSQPYKARIDTDWSNVQQTIGERVSSMTSKQRTTALKEFLKPDEIIILVSANEVEGALGTHLMKKERAAYDNQTAQFNVFLDTMFKASSEHAQQQHKSEGMEVGEAVQQLDNKFHEQKSSLNL